MIPTQKQSANRARIINGRVASMRAFPWMVRITVKQPDGTSLLCGGALLPPGPNGEHGQTQTVLTAAHCVSR